MKAWIVYQPTAWRSDILASLVREDGAILGQHMCSHPNYAPGDLWVHRSEQREANPDLEVDLTPRAILDFQKEFPEVFDKTWTIDETSGEADDATSIL